MHLDDVDLARRFVAGDPSVFEELSTDLWPALAWRLQRESRWRLSAHDLDVTGFRTLCTCLSASKLPITVVRGEDAHITLTVFATVRSQHSRQTAILYVSGQATDQVPVIVESELDMASLPNPNARSATRDPHSRSAVKSRPKL